MTTGRGNELLSRAVCISDLVMVHQEAFAAPLIMEAVREAASYSFFLEKNIGKAISRKLSTNSPVKINPVESSSFLRLK